MKKVIVTGATGFIGKALVKKLLDKDIVVYAIVRDKNKINFSNHSKLKIVECDMNEISNLKDLILDRDIDTLYHFAWDGVSGERQKDGRVQLINIKNTLDLIDILHIFGIKKFVGAGSIHETECLVSMQDGFDGVPVGQMYKVAKLSCHHMAKTRLSECGIECVWAIITNVYGPGEFSTRLINSTVRKLLKSESPKFSKGDQLYDFIYIDDAANAFYLIGEKGSEGRKYIIGSGIVKELRLYLEELGNIVNPNVELGFGKVGFQGIYLHKSDLVNNHLLEDTGFSSIYSFEEGILDIKKELESTKIKRQGD